MRQPGVLYAERGADGIIETTAGPDDLEAHEELLRVVAERDLLRAEKAGAMQAARTAMNSLQIIGRENDLLRAGPSAAQILGHSSLQRLVAQWQREARQQALTGLWQRFKRKRRKVRKLRKRIEELAAEVVELRGGRAGGAP